MMEGCIHSYERPLFSAVQIKGSQCRTPGEMAIGFSTGPHRMHLCDALFIMMNIEKPTTIWGDAVLSSRQSIVWQHEQDPVFKGLEMDSTGHITIKINDFS